MTLYVWIMYVVCTIHIKRPLHRDNVMAGTKRALTPKQYAFVQEYLIDKNGTQAAIRAGYSPKTANEQAARLLAKVSVDQVVTSELAKLSEKAGITVEAVITTIKRLLKSAEDTGNLHAALKACDMLAKHLGMYVERIEEKKDIHITWGQPDQIIEAEVISPALDTPLPANSNKVSKNG